MRVLVACEESQRVCTAFREKGHEAFSCDLIDQSGGHPEWHIKDDCTHIIGGDCSFLTCDGILHQFIGKWDLIIAHPPCTYLTVAGNKWYNSEHVTEERINARNEAVEFFMLFVRYQHFKNCKMCIENPVGYMNTHYRKPDQIIHPYQYGEPYAKRTCLWLYNLPELKPTKILERPSDGWANQNFDKYGKNRGFNGTFTGSEKRSKTFQGIAKAMAEQWG